MQMEEFMIGIAVIGLISFLVFLPVRFFVLIAQVKSLELKVARLTARLPESPEELPARVPESSPAPASVEVPTAIVPPPLPTTPVRANAVVGPDPLFERLRDLGLLPPAELKGEYALGAWWAVRVGGVLAVAAVIFLGIWLNLRSTIPPVVRVLEVALVGAGLFWGGQRLSLKRADLGQVVAAAGLAVWQFAAWATYGLDKMRICDSAAFAAVVQFGVALWVAAIALWKRSKLFGQLAVIFASVAVYFSIGAGEAPVQTAVGAGLIALLGVLLMVRGPWGSAGVLGLIGSQACLLLLYDAMPSKDADYLPLQLAALGSFLALWIGERLVRFDVVLDGGDTRAALQLASFFAPACLSLFLATGGETNRASVSLLIAAVASIAGYLELSRRRLVSEVLFMAAVGFVGAGLAWFVEPHLVWLIWVLAAAGTLVVGMRTRSELVRWSAEILAGAAAFAFLHYPPQKPWIALLGLAALGLMLSYREDWERLSGFQQVRRFFGILGVALVVLFVQNKFPAADTGWPWLVLFLVAAMRYRPALLWAAGPGYLVSVLFVVFNHAGSTPWPEVWALMMVLINTAMLWRLVGRMGIGVKILRNLLSFVTPVLVFAGVHFLARDCFSDASSVNFSAVKETIAWGMGGLVLLVLSSLLCRCGVVVRDLSLFAAGALFGYAVQFLMVYSPALHKVGLALTPFILLGLGCLLYILAIHTREQGVWGSVQRAVIGSGFLLSAFIMLAGLPGAGVSLFWALASVLTFVLGHLLVTRTLRMIGLVGLVIATIRVLSHDITDLLGRIAACGAVAVAFFGIAWLYGRITGDQKDA